MAHPSKGFPHKGHIHANLMGMAWILFANLGLWCQYFQSSPIFVQLHTICMVIVIFLTWISGFMAFIEFGFDDFMPIHIALGIAALVIVAMVGVNGVVCKLFKGKPKIKAELVAIIGKVHKFSGWFLLVLAWTQYVLTFHGKKRITVIILNLISFGGFVLLKYVFKKKAVQTSVSVKDKAEDKDEGRKILEVRSVDQLGKYADEYFIFEDKVYDIENIIGTHPGGWELIKAIKGRQVDRYMYGTQALQVSHDFFLTIHSHFDQSIKMAGQPIAILGSVSPYAHMKEENIAGLVQLTKQCKNPIIYTPYLSPKQNASCFEFSGYTDLSQLGKYFTLNVDKNITRLYSCVNFLQLSNLDLIKSIVGHVLWEKSKFVFFNQEILQIHTNDQFQVRPYIPLLIKKYAKGKFTNQFLSGNFAAEIKISKPRGRGLALHELKPGRILILVAGTGLNPFCDLIDLIYKQALLFQNHKKSSKILQLNPILQTRPFKNFELIIYLSVSQLNQIHPITLHQCSYLAQHKRIKLNILCKYKQQNLFDEYQGLTAVNERFENVLHKQTGISGRNLEQIYICGPPRFNQVIISELEVLNVPRKKYTVM